VPGEAALHDRRVLPGQDQDAHGRACYVRALGEAVSTAAGAHDPE
jgi:hypothetical protein